MMHLTPHSPPDIYREGPDYIHALEVTAPSRLLFVSGTMGLDPASTAGHSLDVQLELVWSNLRKILRSADLTVDNIVRVTSYMTDPGYAEANAAARVAALGGRPVPTTAIVVQTLEPEWLIEIEIIAAS